jgi:hypothetical protein
MTAYSVFFYGTFLCSLGKFVYRGITEARKMIVGDNYTAFAAIYVGGNSVTFHDQALASTAFGHCRAKIVERVPDDRCGVRGAQTLVQSLYSFTRGQGGTVLLTMLCNVRAIAQDEVFGSPGRRVAFYFACAPSSNTLRRGLCAFSDQWSLDGWGVGSWFVGGPVG